MQPDRERLFHILDDCAAIENTIARYGNSFEVFDADPDFQRSVSFSILQIGELANGLSDDFRKATASAMPWHAIRGMRNMVAHSYGSMNRKIIWDTAVNNIPQVKTFCESHLAP